jgi:hypothetical protein
MVRPMSGSGPDSGGQSYVEGQPVAVLARVTSSVWIQQIAGDRECLRLTGTSPRAFLGEAEHQCACGHDHAASFGSLLRSRPLGTAPL